MIKEQIEPIVRRVVEGYGYDLVDIHVTVARRSSTVRIFVDKDGGITIEECARLNQEISTLLDMELNLLQTHSVEVSSPGLERPLKTTRDFQRNIGRLLKINTHGSDGRKDTMVGRLRGVDEETLVLAGKKGEQTVSRNSITLAQIEVEFNHNGSGRQESLRSSHGL